MWTPRDLGDGREQVGDVGPGGRAGAGHTDERPRRDERTRTPPSNRRPSCGLVPPSASAGGPRSPVVAEHEDRRALAHVDGDRREQSSRSRYRPASVAARCMLGVVGVGGERGVDELGGGTWNGSWDALYETCMSHGSVIARAGRSRRRPCASWRTRSTPRPVAAIVDELHVSQPGSWKSFWSEPVIDGVDGPGPEVPALAPSARAALTALNARQRCHLPEVGRGVEELGAVARRPRRSW
jgi:hypothetical protein